jgi:hypothetical protein
MSNSSKTLVKPKHADLATEWARQYAAGELQAGWWDWQHKNSSGDWYSIGPCQMYSPSFYISTEYRYIKTDKHPQYDRHAEVKAEWEKVKDKGTHEIWAQSERNGKWHCCGQGALFDSPGPYEIRKIKPKLLDIRKLPKYAVVSHVTTPDLNEIILSSDINPDVTNIPCLDTKYNDVDWRYFQNLRLREQKDWQVHLGGDCPVPEGVEVAVLFRGYYYNKTNNTSSPASSLCWNHNGGDVDIIAYRITGLAKGWTDNPSEAE